MTKHRGDECTKLAKQFLQDADPAYLNKEDVIDLAAAIQKAVADWFRNYRIKPTIADREWLAKRMRGDEG
jgi:hypothetical protein